MNKKRKKILIALVSMMIGIGIAAALALKAFESNLLYFYSPHQVVAGEAPTNRPFRIGGLVVAGSVRRDPQSLKVEFVLTDTLQEVKVVYDGILPDLFREGQGIVANGRLDANGLFNAAQVLAKHDENYMPPEVAAALANAGLTDAGVEYPHGKEGQRP